MFKPAITKCWEKFLEFHGFHYDRTKGSHDQWVKPKHRTIPVRGKDKHVPGLHIKTGCFSIGCTTDDFYEWASKNC